MWVCFPEFENTGGPVLERQKRASWVKAIPLNLLAHIFIVWCFARHMEVFFRISHDDSRAGLCSSPCRVWDGNPLQYSCLENSMDRDIWQAIVHGVSKSQTRLSDFHTHTHTHTHTRRVWSVAGEFHGQRNLAGYSPWGRKESDTTERLSHTHTDTHTRTHTHTHAEFGVLLVHMASLPLIL